MRALNWSIINKKLPYAVVQGDLIYTVAKANLVSITLSGTVSDLCAKTEHMMEWHALTGAVARGDVYPLPIQILDALVPDDVAPAGKQGSRFNKGRPRMSLIDPLASEGLARVLTAAAEGKYAPHNWRKGFPWSEVLDSMERHIAAIKRGELIDPDFGEQHIDHIGCNWMFLSNFMKSGLGVNDLPTKEQVCGEEKDATR